MLIFHIRLHFKLNEMLLKTPHKFICSQEIKIPEQSSKNGGGKSTENFAVTTRFNDGHIVACDSRLLTLISVFFPVLNKRLLL